MDFDKKLNLAFEYFEGGKLNEASTLYDELLTNSTTNKEESAVRLNYGYVLAELNRLNEALENYELLESLGIKIGNKKIISQSYHQQGMVYRLAENYSKAIDLFTQERHYINAHFPLKHLFLAANNYELGYTYLLMNEFEKSNHFLHLSLDKAILTQDPIMLGSSYRGLGEYYQVINQSNKARRYFNKSLQHFTKAEDIIAVEKVKQLLK